MKNMNRWIRVAAGGVIFLMAGLIYSWSVMSRTISASRDWSTSALSLTFTITMISFFLGNLIYGFTNSRIKARVFVIVSGVMIFAGLTTAGMCGDSPLLMYLGFGIFCGLGSGFAYNAVISTVTAWFPDKPGIISGILLMCFSMGSFVIGRIFAAAAPADGSEHWKTVYLSMGVVILVLMLICSVFIVRPERDPRPLTAREKEAGAAAAAVGDRKASDRNHMAAGDRKASDRNHMSAAVEMKTADVVREKSFWFFYLWVMLVTALGLTLAGQASGFASQVGEGVSGGMIATAVGLVSVASGVGRVVFGVFYDTFGYRKTILIHFAAALSGQAILLSALVFHSFAIVFVGFLVTGFSNGAVSPVQSALVREFYGAKYYSSNLSIVLSNLLISSFATTVAGKLYDVSGSYISTVCMMFTFTMIAFLASFGIKKPGESTQTFSKRMESHEQCQI